MSCATSDLKFPLLQFSPYISLYGSAAILRERKVWVESGRPPFCLKFLVMRSYELLAGKENFLLFPRYLLQRAPQKKIVLRWNDAPFAPTWDQIKRE